MTGKKTYRIFLLRKIILIILIVLFQIKIQGQESRYLAMSSGLQLSAERDYGFSPLVYTGPGGFVSLSYTAGKQNVSDYLSLSLAAGILENKYGKKMKVYTGSIQSFTFYHKNNPGGSGVRGGWSLNSEFSIRDSEIADNFNYRSDFFSSAGPAFRYRLPLGFSENKLIFETLGFFQLLGLKISSSYVDSGISGYDNNLNTEVGALVKSLDWFYPGNALNFGLWTGLAYKFSTGNMIGLHYRYDYISLKNLHLSEKSRSKWFISLSFNL